LSGLLNRRSRGAFSTRLHAASNDGNTGTGSGSGQGVHRAGTSQGIKNPYEGMSVYEILGVPQTANLATIKAAHRKLVATWHPDKYFQDTDAKKSEATARMEKINRAYYILNDEDRRARYDRYGEAGVGTSAASEEVLKAQGGPNPFGSMFDGQGGGGMGGMDINDLFSSLFGGGGGGVGEDVFVGFGGAGGGMGGGGRGKRSPRGPQPGKSAI
jgi:DnaJ-class molecular chaperone